MSKVRDVHKPSNFDTTIELGNKVRTLVYDLNAFAELEDLYGSVENALARLEGGRMKDVRNILWAALIHEEVILDEVTKEPKGYKITPYEVGSWVPLSKVQAISELISRAVMQGLPESQIKNALEEAEKVLDSKMAKIVPTEEELREQAENAKN